MLYLETAVKPLQIPPMAKPDLISTKRSRISGAKCPLDTSLSTSGTNSRLVHPSAGQRMSWTRSASTRAETYPAMQGAQIGCRQSSPWVRALADRGGGEEGRHDATARVLLRVMCASALPKARNSTTLGGGRCAYQCPERSDDARTGTQSNTKKHKLQRKSARDKPDRPAESKAEARRRDNKRQHRVNEAAGEIVPCQTSEMAILRTRAPPSLYSSEVV